MVSQQAPTLLSWVRILHGLLDKMTRKLSLVTPDRKFRSKRVAHGKCPGGEGAVLKTVGPKGLAGSNPVLSVLDNRASDGWKQISENKRRWWNLVYTHGLGPCFRKV